MLTVTVSQINRYVKSLLESDAKLADLYVKGEISNFNRHYKSGHCYFSLKDGEGAVKCVMFRGDASLLRFRPDNGMAVVARARVGVYERDGVYQLYVTDLQPDGAGALAVAFAQLRVQLAQEGLFDEGHKKPMPRLPMRVGVITSQTGAALQDILSVLNRRFPLCTAVVCPASVQGDGAPRSLRASLETLDRVGRCDVIIMGRGGGSAEDLWCFNDPDLARAVFRCVTPIVSAVGHETDYTILDYVADLRAPTPSAAAELVVPDRNNLRAELADMGKTLSDGIERRMSLWNYQLEGVRRHRALRSPMRYTEKNKEKLDFLRKALYNRKRMILGEKGRRMAAAAALLDSLSPLRVLDRGYSLALRSGQLVRSAEMLVPGDRLELRFGSGSAQAVVESVTGEERGDGVEEKTLL